MTNGEKYKTTEERVKAFKEWCQGLCGTCPLERHILNGCGMLWLDLEAEEDKPLPCQYCGAETRVEEYLGMDHKPHYRVVCDDCYMQSCAGSRKDVVEKYNLVARAVIAAKESEAK